MPEYAAPLAEMTFVLEEIAGLAELATLPGLEEATGDTVEAVLGEAGRLAGEVLSPLNQSGDRESSHYENGVVRTPRGFVEAYVQFVEGGWNSVSVPAAEGGQGLPHAVATATGEMWNGANMSFALCPLLTAGSIDLLLHHGSEEQKRLYLPKLVTGEWNGTMNLTEPQAGSDVGALKTRAVREGDHYRITGQKIFITYGENDLSRNVIHMVLARLPGAPAGTKGISLFIVPKLLLNEDGRPGQRNDLRCVSIEHKLGIKASPTCVMAFGDGGGAIGYLVGEENRGMEYMFTMMNSARLAVGVQGLGIAERAYQQAVAYARERRQSRALGAADATPAAIVHHPDVRRSLATMRAYVEGGRALAYAAGAAVDRQAGHPDDAVRQQAAALVEVLTPVVKSWLTDMALTVTSLNIQVHGGMGFIEETGAAQHYRDARILPIYEGTNGIQALDLVMRKILRDRGRALALVEAWLAEAVQATADSADPAVQALAPGLGQALDRLRATGQWLLAQGADPAVAAAAATPFLNLFGLVAAGCLLGRSAAAAARRQAEGRGEPAFNARKVKTARFYLDNLLPYAEAEARRALDGAASTLALEPEDF